MRPFACVVLLALLESACSRSAQSCLEHGNNLARAGKYSEAQFEYRASIAKDPRSAEAYYRLGLADSALGDGSAALDALQRALSLSPGHEPYAIALGDLALEAYQEEPDKKSYDQVRQQASDLLRKNPRSFDGLRLQGELLIIDRKYDEALAELRKAEAIQPLDPKAGVPMVRALLAQNHIPEAEALAHRVLEAHRDCGPLYDVLVSYYSGVHRSDDIERLLKAEVIGLPKDVRPRLKLAALYRDSGKSQEMAATLDGIRKDRAPFPDAPGLVGDFYANAGDWEKALTLYQDGARSAVKGKELYGEGIARALAAMGRPKEAIDQLNKVLKAHPANSSALLTRAILLRDSETPGDVNLAIADLKVLSGRAPADAVLRYNLGLAYVANGDLKAATTELTQSANLQPGYDAPLLALADLAEKREDHAQTIQFTEQILTTDPDNRQARLIHVDALIGNKNYFRARTELQSLLGSHPDSMDVDLRLAVLDTIERKYSDAESRYRRLYRPGADDLRPLQGLVELYLTETQTAKAEALLEQELRQAPNSAEVHLLAASTAVQEGNHGRAIEQYEWLRAKDPASLDALKALGDLYLAEGDMERAIAMYKKASALAPRDESLLNNLALLQNDAGDLTGAIVTLRKQLALNPEDAEVMNNLAFDLAEMGTDLDHAMALAATAARKLSDDPGVLDTLGWVYAKAGLNESAIQIFRNLVNKDPDHPVYRYHLGVAFLQAHKSIEAKSEFTIALSQKPAKELAQKIQALSSQL